MEHFVFRDLIVKIYSAYVTPAPGENTVKNLSTFVLIIILVRMVPSAWTTALIISVFAQIHAFQAKIVISL